MKNKGAAHPGENRFSHDMAHLLIHYLVQLSRL